MWLKKRPWLRMDERFKNDCGLEEMGGVERWEEKGEGLFDMVLRRDMRFASPQLSLLSPEVQPRVSCSCRCRNKGMLERKIAPCCPWAGLSWPCVATQCLIGSLKSRNFCPKWLAALEDESLAIIDQQ